MNHNFRKKMGKHVGLCRNNSLLVEQESEKNMAHGGHAESPTDNNFETVDSVCNNDDQNHSDSDDISFSVEADVDEDVVLSKQSFSASQLTYASLPLPIYGVLATDNYVQMEIEMHHNHDQRLGGYRSACWRSRYRHDLFGPDNMFSVDDAKFMLYVTSLTRQNTGSTNDTLFKLLGAIEKRHDLSYMRDTVVIPTDSQTANKYVLKGKYSIMENLPRPKAHTIAGHACFRVADVLSLHMAFGRSVEFTVIPASDAIDEN